MEIFDPFEDFWFDREDISSLMKLLKSKTVILTNISKHKRRIVTHKKMKFGIQKFYSSVRKKWCVTPCFRDIFNPVKSYYEDKEATYKISLGDDLADFIEKIKTIDVQSGSALFKALTLIKPQGSRYGVVGPR